MKKIIEYILAVPLTLCFCSCLEEHPKDQLDKEEIYNNADNIYKNAALPTIQKLINDGKRLVGYDYYLEEIFPYII